MSIVFSFYRIEDGNVVDTLEGLKQARKYFLTHPIFEAAEVEMIRRCVDRNDFFKDVEDIQEIIRQESGSMKGENHFYAVQLFKDPFDPTKMLFRFNERGFYSEKVMSHLKFHYDVEHMFYDNRSDVSEEELQYYKYIDPISQAIAQHDYMVYPIFTTDDVWDLAWYYAKSYNKLYGSYNREVPLPWSFKP